MRCPVCEASQVRAFRVIDGVAYFECAGCTSLFADPAFLARVERGETRNYGEAYWRSELPAARERSFGPALARVAETFLYARPPIRAFVDIGSGPGYLLDAVSTVMPDSARLFHGVEVFPPSPEHRTRHPGYHVGTLATAGTTFTAGVCIEVIEHLPPSVLRTIVRELAGCSEPGALYLFNSGQPEFVKREDPGYLDPNGRGHVIAYGLPALTAMFATEGFQVIPLPGRTWAFLAEYRATEPVPGIDGLFDRVWHPAEANRAALQDRTFGPLMYTLALDGARCYLEHARAEHALQGAVPRAADSMAATRSAVRSALTVGAVLLEEGLRPVQRRLRSLLGGGRQP